MSTNVRSSTADKELLGHEEKTRAFRGLVEARSLGHAYLFFGDDGIGKFRFAVALANLLERKQWEVGRSETLSDVFIVECPEEETSLGIDVVRTIRRFLSETPFHSSRRTVIIRDAERLTWEAESALLKIMEEPPPHALILVVARDPSALFPPLASRMAKVYFARFSREALAELLTRHFGASAREASTLAARSFGRLGYALKIMKNGKGKSKKEMSEETLAEKLEALVLSRFERGVEKESAALSFLLARLEAASRFNLNPRLQERAVAHTIGT
ncbi:MAG: hypothetical protein Q8P88_02270 [Candidatus Jorgensenbacteria bacterium]|nr:hypothetical protein [Candidatus Jorgensenbacteria bacterium]